jgi:hypothetical protein
MRAASEIRLAAVLLVIAVFGAGCGEGKRRTLPFPQLDARAPFPELAGGAGEASAAAPRQNFFADRLASSSRQTEPATVAARRILPLGEQLFGEIPSDAAWSWQKVEDGITLIACAQEDSLAALVYAEAFPARIRIAPSEEIQRFHLTVNPEGAGHRLTPSGMAGSLTGGLVRRVAQETGGGSTEAARLLQLLATRTAGAGLGFRPAPGSFTGWQWVGKVGGSGGEERHVTARLARYTGIWERQTSLSDEVKQRLEVLRRIPELKDAVEQLDALAGNSVTAAAGGVSAYLLVGSATDDSEQAGAHLALLWQHSPDHRCIEGLSSFLASLHTTRPDPSAQTDPGNGQDPTIQRAAGLQLLPGRTMVSLDALQQPAAQPVAPGAATSPPVVPRAGPGTTPAR